MQTLHQIPAVRQALTALHAADETLAFVPTMGNLHEGHISLVRHARALADRVIVSIFVNPLQFGPSEDLDSYPRTLSVDANALIDEGVDYLFAPSVNEMYPHGIAGQTLVKVPDLTRHLCGESRPTHFDGVTTVVSKLFHIIGPNYAVFGRKDYQQLVIIRKMVLDQDIPVEIHGCRIVREPNGLAMSSRNRYLTEAQLRVAATLSDVLREAQQKILAGVRDYPTLESKICQQLESAGFVPDYVSVRHSHTLEVATAQDAELTVFVAAFLGTPRLIDNIQVELPAS